MSFKINFLKNILVSGGYNYLTQIISFLASFIILRLITPENFGLVGLITVFVGFISIFSDSGISFAVIRASYGNSYHRGVNTLSVYIGLGLFFSMLILIYPISHFYKNSALILPGIAISFLFILKSFNIVPSAILQKRMDFGYLGKANFVGAIFNIAGTIVFAFLGFEYWALIWPQFLSSAIIYLILIKRVDLPFGLVRKPLLVKSFVLTKALIKSLIGFNLINYWARNADNLIVGKVYGESDLGIYNRAYTMLTLPLSLITGVFSSVLYPSLIKLKQEGGDIFQEYYFSLKIISLLNLPVAVLLMLFPREFVQVLWGSTWMPVAELLPYFGLLLLTQSLLSTVGSILIMEGKEKQMVISGWIGAFFMIFAIIAAAQISLKAIAQFYTLSYIIFVLTFNIIYIYSCVLKCPPSLIWKFWFPKVMLSALIWFFLYNDQFTLLSLTVAGWTLVILIDSKDEIQRLLRFGLKKRLKDIN